MKEEDLNIIVKKFIHKISPFQKRRMIVHTFHEILHENDIPSIAFMLDNGFDIEQDLTDFNPVNSGENRTPLLCSIYQVEIKTIEYIINRGADVNVQTRPRDSVGMTPLHESILRKRYDVAELLYKNGADPNKRCSRYRNAKPETVLDLIEREEIKELYYMIENNKI